MDISPKIKRSTRKNTRKEKIKRNGKYSSKGMRSKEININKYILKQDLSWQKKRKFKFVNLNLFLY